MTQELVESILGTINHLLAAMSDMNVVLGQHRLWLIILTVVSSLNFLFTWYLWGRIARHVHSLPLQER